MKKLLLHISAFWYFSTGQGIKEGIVLVVSLFAAMMTDQVLASFEEQMVNILLFA